MYLVMNATTGLVVDVFRSAADASGYAVALNRIANRTPWNGYYVQPRVGS